MELTFLGAAHEVTGSCTLISACGKNILVDYGLEQGKDTFVNCDLMVEPSEIDGVLVTHEHSDHVSGIRVFTNKFDCPVYAGEKTLEKITCYNGTSVVAGEFFEIGGTFS